MEALTKEMNGGHSIANGQPWTLESARDNPALPAVFGAATQKQRNAFFPLFEDHNRDLQASQADQPRWARAQLICSDCKVAHSALSAAVDGDTAWRRQAAQSMRNASVQPHPSTP
jgi:hypothetical protein